jgi:hypothetical protein
MKCEPSKKQAKAGASLNLLLISASFLLGSLLNPEEGSTIFL